MRLSYRIVNVFTQSMAPAIPVLPASMAVTRNSVKLTGNPLCVFEDARGLDDAQMQALALQFNLSETTFLFPSDKAHARVRIFAPGYEMQFAGHPTLGTAFVVDSLQQRGGKVQLELNVGVIPVEAQGNQWELQANAATSRSSQASRAELATALGLHASDLGAQALWVNTGSEQLIVPLTSADAVRRVSASYDALAASDCRRPAAASVRLRRHWQRYTAVTFLLHQNRLGHRRSRHRQRHGESWRLVSGEFAFITAGQNHFSGRDGGPTVHPAPSHRQRTFYICGGRGG